MMCYYASHGYCVTASLVNLDVGVLLGLEELPVISNVGSEAYQKLGKYNGK